eukprot:Sspe_Gene.33128::Locus_16207_Transcript_4_6_Confidence_0.218_Length_3879::g.33128::m.33128
MEYVREVENEMVNEFTKMRMEWKLFTERVQHQITVHSNLQVQLLSEEVRSLKQELRDVKATQAAMQSHPQPQPQPQPPPPQYDRTASDREIVEIVTVLKKQVDREREARDQETRKLQGQVDNLTTALRAAGTAIGALEGEIEAMKADRPREALDHEVVLTDLRVAVAQCRRDLEVVQTQVGELNEEMLGCVSSVKGIQNTFHLSKRAPAPAHTGGELSPPYFASMLTKAPLPVTSSDSTFSNPLTRYLEDRATTDAPPVSTPFLSLPGYFANPPPPGGLEHEMDQLERKLRKTAP